MKNLFVRFVREENGQDLIEYSLLAAIIAVGSIVAMGPVSTEINAVFTHVDDRAQDRIVVAVRRDRERTELPSRRVSLQEEFTSHEACSPGESRLQRGPRLRRSRPHWLCDESGQDLIEYALLSAVLSVGFVGTIQAVARWGHPVLRQGSRGVSIVVAMSHRTIDLVALLHQGIADDSGQDVVEYALLGAIVGDRVDRDLAAARDDGP